MLRQHVLDHVIVHGGYHAGRVRIVRNDEVPRAAADLQLLFPHDTVLTTDIGCCHTCLYTDDAAASLVAERIAEHLRDFDHATADPRPKHEGSQAGGLGQEVWR